MGSEKDMTEWARACKLAASEAADECFGGDAWKQESAFLLLALSLLSTQQRTEKAREVAVLSAIAQHWICEYSLIAVKEDYLPYSDNYDLPEAVAIRRPFEKALYHAKAARGEVAKEIDAMRWLAGAVAGRKPNLATLLTTIADGWENSPTP